MCVASNLTRTHFDHEAQLNLSGNMHGVVSGDNIIQESSSNTIENYLCAANMWVVKTTQTNN